MSTSSSNDVVRCAIYVRSACDEAGSSSLTDQERLCREAIAGHSTWHLNETLIFRDLGRSGTTSNGREGLDDLLAKAGEHPRPFDKVVVADAGRLGREINVVSRMLSIFKFYGISVYLESAHLDSTDPNFEMVLMYPVAAEEHRVREFGRRVFRGQQGRVLQGYSVGGRCYGYTAIPAMATSENTIAGVRLEIQDSEAVVVRRIYQLYADGMNAPDIADLLNAEGIAAPGRPGYAVRSLWNSRSIFRVLRNQLYRGVVVWNRTKRVRNPTTGRIVSRQNPEAEVLWHTVPHLRIVDATLEQAVDLRLSNVGKRIPRRYNAERGPRDQALASSSRPQSAEQGAMRPS